jgi:acyl dehydratase
LPGTDSMQSRQSVLEAMRNDIGQESEPGEWFVITQKLIDDYVDLTGETGWIHTDVERAKQSTLGNTIAPGNMGIAILPKLSRAISPYSRYPRKYSLNQGWNRIRFLQPLLTGSHIRARSKLLAIEERPDGSLRVEVEFRIEVEGSDKPWLTGVKVGRFFFD